MYASIFLYVYYKIEGDIKFYSKRKDHDDKKEGTTSQEKPQWMNAFNYLLNEVYHFFYCFYVFLPLL